MKNKERIQHASGKMRGFLSILILVMPALNAAVWVFINTFPEAMQRSILPYFVTVPLPVSAQIMGFMVTMIPTGIAMAGAYHLMRLFSLYQQGHIFSPSNVRCFKNLSRVLIWWFAAGIVQRTLLGIALTLHYPPGHRILTISLGSPDLTALLLGIILAIIAWVMEEGRKLQADQDFTI